MTVNAIKQVDSIVK